MKIRDRIKSLRRVKASTLIPNPKNWRTHPQEQKDAMRGVLDQVGYADALLARETPDGLMLIDGHLRAEISPDEKVPVLILDVDEKEADLILATHDPLAAMAEVSSDELAALIESVEIDSEALQAMIDELAEDAGVKVPEFTPVRSDEQSRLDEKARILCPHCSKEFVPK